MIVQWIALAWGMSELALALSRRADRKVAIRMDRGSIHVIWMAIAVGMFGGAFLSHVPAGRFTIAPIVTAVVALTLLAAGVAIRVVAIVTLDRSFTVDVAIRPDQTLVRHGLYRFLRHPSYTGAFLSFLGCAIGFANWFSATAVMIPVLAAFAYRIAVEERALGEAFGTEYADYAARTKRLIPFIF